MTIIFISPVGLSWNVDYTSKYQIGAVEQQIWGIANKLGSAKEKIYISIPSFEKNKIIKHNNCHLVYVSIPAIEITKSFSARQKILSILTSFLKSLAYVINLKQIVDRIDPDCIFCSTLLESFFISFLFKSKPKFSICHNLDIYSINERIFTPFIILMLRRIAKEFDGIIPLVESQKDYLLENGIDCLNPIPNAIELSDFQSVEYNPDGDIVFAGRLVPHKRVDLLIRAFSDIRNSTTKNLLIIGSGPEEKKLKDLVYELKISNRVNFVSILPRVEYYKKLSKCSMLVLPSEAEGFGVVLIEAMAFNIPTIARSVVGPKDIIKHGYNGYLFCDDDELKKYMLHLANNEKERITIGLTARKEVEEKFSFEKISERYDKIFNEILEDADVKKQEYISFGKC